MHTLTLHLQALVADALTTAKHGFRLWRADIRELWIIHRDLRRASMLMATRPSHAGPEHGEAMFFAERGGFPDGARPSGGPLATGALPPAVRGAVPAGIYAVPRGVGHCPGGRPAG